MYRVEICDSERGSALRLERMLKDRLDQISIRAVSEEHLQMELGTAAVRPDILFISIRLGTKSGVSLATQLQKLNPMLCVIFLASGKDDISMIFDAEPTGLLMKPFQMEKVHDALDRALQRLNEDDTEFLQLKNRESLLRVRYQDIYYVESDRRNLYINWKGGRDRVRMKLSELEALLPDYFVRCHQSYLVNLNAVVRETEHSLKLVCGRTVPVSRSRRRQTGERLRNYFGEKK